MYVYVVITVVQKIIIIGTKLLVPKSSLAPAVTKHVLPVICRTVRPPKLYKIWVNVYERKKMGHMRSLRNIIRKWYMYFKLLSTEKFYRGM